MKCFGYVFDPLFILCCGLYATNRWLIKPHTQIAFFHNWFNDILLIPCALPLVLLAQRRLGLRAHDRPPTLSEVVGHVVGWSILFEVIGPHIMRTVGDPWDAAAYAAGGAAAFVFWHFAYPASPGRANFDWLAPYYRWMERWLAGGKLQRCRAAFLRDIKPPQEVLIVGQGHGPFLELLLRTFPKSRCTCVDSSARMLQTARERIVAAGLEPGRVEFVHADVLDWRPPGRAYDWIVTHFVLDCFRPEQLDQLLPKLSAAAAPEACWLVADFQQPAAGAAKWRARAILEVMYLFFRWATALPAAQLTPPEPHLERAGFALRRRETFEWGLLHSDLWIKCR